MKKIAGLAAVFLVAMAVFLSEVHEAEAVTCSPLELSPCLGAITTGQAPSGACCGKMREQRPCFCGYLKDPSLRQYVNSPNARKIVSSCGISVPGC